MTTDTAIAAAVRRLARRRRPAPSSPGPGCRAWCPCGAPLDPELLTPAQLADVAARRPPARAA